MGYIIAVIIVALIMLGIAALIKNCIFKPLKTINNKCEAIYQKHELFSSIGKAYEEVCLNNPLKYENNKRVPRILCDYKRLLRGEILDECVKHAPSERITVICEGDEVEIFNDDYMTYVKNQAKAFKKAGNTEPWFENELKRISKEQKEDKLLRNFRGSLMELGLPAQYIFSAVTNNRVLKYKPEDWKKLIEAIKFYAQNNDDAYIFSYLDNVDDKDTLIDQTKFDAFVELVDVDIKPKLAGAFIQDKIKESDLKDVLTIIHNSDVSIDTALTYLVERKKVSSKEKTLREKYAETLKR